MTWSGSLRMSMREITDRKRNVERAGPMIHAAAAIVMVKDHRYCQQHALSFHNSMILPKTGRSSMSKLNRMYSHDRPDGQTNVCSVL
ncbi:unnamed protein product [Victoria cruziana]